MDIQTTSYLNYQISYLNAEEFADLKREIFTHQLYYFETDFPTPVIIDAGAHLGLATLYFKNLYPQAKILAFEPNPLLFPLLKENIAQNHLENVTLIQAALSKHNDKTTFYYDATPWQWLSTGSLTQNAWNGKQKTLPVSIQSVRLDQYLSQYPQIDLLKLDIEGAESAVLLSIRDSLSKIKEIIFEFHPTGNQKLAELLSFLTKKGFICTLTDRQGKKMKVYHYQELVIIHAQQK